MMEEHNPGRNGSISLLLREPELDQAVTSLVVDSLRMQRGDFVLKMVNGVGRVEIIPRGVIFESPKVIVIGEKVPRPERGVIFVSKDCWMIPQSDGNGGYNLRQADLQQAAEFSLASASPHILFPKESVPQSPSELLAGLGYQLFGSERWPKRIVLSGGNNFH